MDSLKRGCTVGLLACALLALFTTAVHAYEIPGLITEGFEKYLKEGPKAAIEVWTKGSAMEGSKDALSQANNFRQVQDFYGNYLGYNIIRAKEHSPSSAVYLVEMKYEKGNLFSKFFVYKKPDGKYVMTTFNFHTVPENVWPNSVVFGCDEK